MSHQIKQFIRASKLKLSIFLWLFTLLHSVDTIAQQSPTVGLNPATIADSIDLLNLGELWIDSSEHTKFQRVKGQNFIPVPPNYHPRMLAFKPYWVRIKLKNENADSVLRGYLSAQIPMDVFEIYDDNGVLLGQGGRDLPRQKKDFHGRTGIISLILNPNETKLFYVKMTEVVANSAFLNLNLLSKSLIEKLDKSKEDGFNNVSFFWGFLLIALFCVALFAFLQFGFLKDKAQLWYALYLLTYLLFYLRNYEHDSNSDFFFNYIGYLSYFEAPLGYCIYITYTYFLIHFLNIESQYPREHFILRCLAGLLVTCLCIYVLIFSFIGYRQSFNFYNVSRTITYIIAFYYLYILFFRIKNKPHVRYIGIGATFLMFGILFTVVSENFGLRGPTIGGGLFRLCQIGSVHIPMYTVRVGLLIEVFCFSLALHRRMKAEKAEQKENEKRLLNLSYEHEVLKKQMSVFATPSTTEGKENDFILRGVKIVDENLDNTQFSVDDFARKMNMSRADFFIAFKKNMDTTPADFISQQRLARACRLLLHSDKTVAEIAFSVGFSEAAYFTKVFSKKLGLSPSEYRKQNKHS